MIDFIRKPAGGGLPFVNIGSHPVEEIVVAITRYASLVQADEILIHAVRLPWDEIKLKVSSDFTTSPDTAVLKRAGKPVAMVVGLPVSKGLLERARQLEAEAK